PATTRASSPATCSTWTAERSSAESVSAKPRRDRDVRSLGGGVRGREEAAEARVACQVALHERRRVARDERLLSRERRGREMAVHVREAAARAADDLDQGALTPCAARATTVQWAGAAS